MGYATCRSCGGTGTKWVRWGDGSQRNFACKACCGTGVNSNLLTKSCERCRTDIVYPVGSTYPPKYCKSCKALVASEREAAKLREALKWREKSCESCGISIRYNIEWSNIPKYCKTCKDKKAQERAEREAKKRTKNCISCGTVINYNVDWTNVPDMCKPCRDKKKAEIEIEKAKWYEIACCDCGATIRANRDWSNPPKRCKNCKIRLQNLRSKESQIKAQAINKLQILIASTWGLILYNEMNEPRSSGRKREWREEDCITHIKFGWDKTNLRPTADVMIYVKGENGHYHFVADDEGNILISEWRDK